MVVWRKHCNICLTSSRNSDIITEPLLDLSLTLSVLWNHFTRSQMVFLGIGASGNSIELDAIFITFYCNISFQQQFFVLSWNSLWTKFYFFPTSRQVHYLIVLYPNSAHSQGCYIYHRSFLVLQQIILKNRICGILNHSV